MARARIHALPSSARAKDVQGARSRSRQHLVGRGGGGRRTRRYPYWRRLSRFRVPCPAARTEGPATSRGSVGHLQQEQPERRAGRVAGSSRDAVAARRLRGGAHELGRQGRQPACDRQGVERRRRGGGTARRQSGRARLGALSASGCAHHRGHERSARDDRGVAAIAGIRAAGAFGRGSRQDRAIPPATASAPPQPSPRTRSKTSCARSR